MGNDPPQIIIKSGLFGVELEVLIGFWPLYIHHRTTGAPAECSRDQTDILLEKILKWRYPIMDGLQWKIPFKHLWFGGSPMTMETKQIYSIIMTEILNAQTLVHWRCTNMAQVWFDSNHVQSRLDVSMLRQFCGVQASLALDIKGHARQGQGEQKAVELVKNMEFSMLGYPGTMGFSIFLTPGMAQAGAWRDHHWDLQGWRARLESLGMAVEDRWLRFKFT